MSIGPQRSTELREDMDAAEARRLAEKLYAALLLMKGAFERRIRSECTPKQLKAEPWRCAEWNLAEEALVAFRQRTKPPL